MVGALPAKNCRPTLPGPSPDSPLTSRVDDRPFAENAGVVSKKLPTTGLHAKTVQSVLNRSDPVWTCAETVCPDGIVTDPEPPSRLMVFFSEVLMLGVLPRIKLIVVTGHVAGQVQAGTH